MKRTLLTLAVAMAVCFSTCAQTKKVVTDSVTFMPKKVKIYEGVSAKGNPKYWIELPTEHGTVKVSMTESHAKSNRLLALIERKDEQTGKYSYSIKFAEKKQTNTSGAKADLSKMK